MKIYRWGIIGPGKIAEKFANTLTYLDGAVLEAVASRDSSRARTFAEKFGAGRHYDNYDALINDHNVDAIYIATPHSFHCEQAIKCLQHHKPVLCEKPMALSYAQVKKMTDASRENKTFLMEAMWTRFIPTTLKTIELIRQGSIGEVKYIRADFGFLAPVDLSGRLYNLRLGGGSLLDVGIYPLSFCVLLMGKPEQISASAHIADTGADLSCQAIFQYENGCMAQIASSIEYKSPLTAEIVGTKGIIYIHSPWYKSNTLTLHKTDQEPVQFSLPLEHNGFEYQVRETMNCLDKGKIQSELMSHDLSISISKTMDEIRRQCGIKYPSE